MDIVQQFQPFSHSLFPLYPPYPLLPAPAPRPKLPAPKIAGLLGSGLPTPVQDVILMRDDPTPPPFVSKDRAMMPPEVLAIIGHLPAPDELEHALNLEMARIFDNLENARRAAHAARRRERGQ